MCRATQTSADAHIGGSYNGALTYNLVAAMRERGRVWVKRAVVLEAPLGEVTPAHRPSPRPPVAARPRRLAVTRISTLIRDPYSIYARYILRLFPLLVLLVIGILIVGVVHAECSAVDARQDWLALINKRRGQSLLLLAKFLGSPADRAGTMMRIDMSEVTRTGDRGSTGHDGLG